MDKNYYIASLKIDFKHRTITRYNPITNDFCNTISHFTDDDLKTDILKILNQGFINQSLLGKGNK